MFAKRDTKFQKLHRKYQDLSSKKVLELDICLSKSLLFILIKAQLNVIIGET